MPDVSGFLKSSTTMPQPVLLGPQEQVLSIPLMAIGIIQVLWQEFFLTGGAGFIGSHLVDELLNRGDDVVVFDNFSSGTRENLAPFRGQIQVIEGDVGDFEALISATQGADYVLHEAAIASVQASIDDPRSVHAVVCTGTLNALTAARDCGVKRFVFASSSSVYGDSPELPKRETMPPDPKSPYALAKLGAELMRACFTSSTDCQPFLCATSMCSAHGKIPKGPYAAVIPIFTEAILAGRTPLIHGDGSQSRDFLYVDNVVFANMLALDAPPKAFGKAFNIGTGVQTSLIELVDTIANHAGCSVTPQFGPRRAGDIDHSSASIELAQDMLGYHLRTSFSEGIERTVAHYRRA